VCCGVLQCVLQCELQGVVVVAVEMLQCVLQRVVVVAVEMVGVYCGVCCSVCFSVWWVSDWR